MSTTTNTTPEDTQERVISKRAADKGRKAVKKNFATLEKLEVNYLPVDSICPNDWNPNRQSDHDFELLLRSMEEDGFTQPVIVLKEPTPEGLHLIVDGEHRWRAGGALGMKQIPVVMVDMTPEQARISTIRHNRARGSHDIQLEADLLRDLQRLGAIEWAQDSLMLDDTELNKLLTDITAAEINANTDYAEAWIPDTVSQEDAELIRSGGKTTAGDVRSDEDGAESTKSYSAQAIEDMRKRERAIESAKTAQDKQVAAREIKFFRVSLVFSGDEAEIVKNVLGDTPAENLLRLCRAGSPVENPMN